MLSSLSSAPRRLNAQLRIGLAFFALALACFGGVAVVSGHHARQQVAAEVSDNLLQIAKTMASSLDGDLFERYREIQNLAAFDALFGPGLEPARWRPTLEQLQRSFEHYAWIGLVGTDGQVRAATGGILETRSVSQRPWFQQAQAAPFVGDLHEAVLLASLLPPQPDGEPLRLVDIAAPLVHGGRTVGVIGAHLSWRWAEERRRYVMQPVEAERRVDIMIVDRRGEPLLGALGKITARLPAQQVDQLVRGGPAIETWNDGRAYLTSAVRSQGYRDYPGLGWSVIVRQPVDTALASARTLQWQIAGLGLLGAALFGLLGWQLAGRLTAPLRLVAARARAHVRVDEPAAAGPDSRQLDETEHLSRSLETLVDRLHHRSEELATLNGQLEQRVSERTEALEQANADLKSFSHSVSHDLKGPIGSIGLAIRQVLTSEEGRLQPRSHNMLTLLMTECDRLRLLVDELMMLAQVEQREMKPVPVPMTALARSVVDAQQRALGAGGLATAATPQVDIGDLPVVEGDPLLLQQVWQNLVSNAFKFTRRVEAPRIDIRADVTEAEIVFSVSDNGAGFDMAQSKRLFGAFQRLHRSSEFPGTGIGLSIVKRIVHRHGGRVWAHSVPGRRTSFYFALPRVTGVRPNEE